MPETLTVAVCVYAGVTLSDFIPNTEILAGLNDADDPVFGKELVEVPFRLKFEYLSPTLDPVVSSRSAENVPRRLTPPRPTRRRWAAARNTTSSSSLLVRFDYPLHNHNKLIFVFYFY
jgi:hypothetical protein